MEMPTGDDLANATEGTDILRMVVAGHGEIEMTLRVAIMELLIDPHTVELERLSFPVKVDLGIAMGSVPKDLRGLLLKLNKIRNEFAHNPRYQLAEEEARSVASLIPEEAREDCAEYIRTADGPRAILRLALVFSFFGIQDRVFQIRASKARKEKWLAQVEDFLHRIDQEEVSSGGHCRKVAE